MIKYTGEEGSIVASRGQKCMNQPVIIVWGDLWGMLYRQACDKLSLSFSRSTIGMLLLLLVVVEKNSLETKKVYYNRHEMNRMGRFFLLNKYTKTQRLLLYDIDRLHRGEWKSRPVVAAAVLTVHIAR